MSENLEKKKKEYIGYCNMCFSLNIKPVPIESFNEDESNKVKETYLLFKK